MINQFDALRNKLNTILPNTNKTVTILEPITKQRLGFLNNMFALRTRGDITEEEANNKLSDMFFNIILDYLKQNIKPENENEDILLYDVNDLLVYALTLIEFIANNWFVNTEHTCQHCKATNKFRLVFEPAVLQNPNASYVDRITTIKQLFEIDDSNFVPLYIHLPEKPLEPKVIQKKINDEYVITLKLYYPIAQLVMPRDITLMSLAYVHQCKIASEDNMKLLFLYDASMKVGNKTLADLAKQMEQLPERIYNMIQFEITKYVEHYTANHQIEFKYSYNCASCGKENKDVKFDVFEHFLSYLVGNTM